MENLALFGKRFKFYLILVVALISLARTAFSSVTLSQDDPAYRYLDKLMAHGLIVSTIVGHRPYTRQEVAQMIKEATQRYPNFEQRFRTNEDISIKESARRHREKVYVDKILKELKHDFARDLDALDPNSEKANHIYGDLFERLRFQYIYLGENTEAVIPENGLGGVTAQIQSLTENDEGRHYVRGSNFAFETRHWAQLGSHFSLLFEPRYQFQFPQGEDSENGNGVDKVFIQRLNAQFTWKRLGIEIGRDAVQWGVTPTGGLFFSHEARPLDMAKISSLGTFRYPFFFKHFGEAQWSLILANLGPEQRFSYPWFLAVKNSHRSTRYLEVGTSLGFLFGGNGEKPEENVDRNAALEILGTIPLWNGFQIYSEFYLEDIHASLSQILKYDMSYLAGVYFPRLNHSGTIDLRLEYRWLSPRYARHPVYTNGLTINRFLLGDPLGPDAQGVKVEFRYEANLNNLFKLGFYYDQRDSNLYDSKPNQVFNGPTESRYRGQVGIWHRFNSHLIGETAVNFERGVNLGFDEGDDRWNWSLGGKLDILFPPFFSLK